MSAKPRRRPLSGQGSQDSAGILDAIERKRDHFRSERNKEAFIQLMKVTFMRLQELYNELGDKREALRQWGRKHVQENYPGLGENVAYAIPPFYIGKPDACDTSGSGISTEKQESSVRGHVAACKVELAFRLLSNKMERNHQKPLVVISNLQYENVMIWPENVRKILTVPDDFVPKNCPDMVTDANDKTTFYYGKPTQQNQNNSQQRGEGDLIILHQTVGIIFVEIKSYGTYPESEGDEQGAKKINKAKDQLDRNERCFRATFADSTELLGVKRHRIVALPNLSEDEAIRRCGPGKDVIYLTKDNMFDEDLEKPEIDYDLTQFEKWWEKTFSTEEETTQPAFTPQMMQDSVARYLGPLSRPLSFGDSQAQSHIRTLNDAIQYTGKIFKKRIFTSHDLNETEPTKAKLDEFITGEQFKRVHLKGPPRSGKSTLTILKAKNFLEPLQQAIVQPLQQAIVQPPQQAIVQPPQQAIVIVVDMYRGNKGRPGGIHVYQSIMKENPTDFENKVHHLKFDANNNMLEKFNKKMAKIKSKDSTQNKHLLFVIDQILPIHFWEDVLAHLDSEYKESHVWISDGLVEQSLGDRPKIKFHEIRLRQMCRIPPTVRKVLYQVDWIPTEDKRKRYSMDSRSDEDVEGPAKAVPLGKDATTGKAVVCGEGKSTSPGQDTTECTELNTTVCTSMTGPTVLTVRHQHHKPETDMLNCETCAEDLAALLRNKLKLFKEGASDKQMLDCSIVILFNIPEHQYQPSEKFDDQYVEICSSKCESYSAKVANSELVKKLEMLLPVKIISAEKEKIEDFESEERWDNILLCWVDKFQGVDRDVVIYLPSEMAQTKGATAPEPFHGKQKSSEPDYREKCRAEASAEPETRKRRLPLPGVSIKIQKKEEEQDVTEAIPQPSNSSSSPADGGKLAHLYWTLKDTERYSDWDKTNLMFAGTRAEGQLILMVP